MTQSAEVRAYGNETALANNLTNASLIEQIRAIPEFKAIKLKQRRFILAYSGTFGIQQAARLTGIAWPNHYKWLRESKDYKQAFDYAKEIAADYAEGDIYNRAFIGEDRKVTTRKGDQVITEEYKDKSDILSMFMLKGMRPQYRDSFNPAGAAAPVQIAIVYPGAPAAAIDVTPKTKDE
jgi:hypothetical protein